MHDRYEIIAELGKGGMSTVYLAKDKNLDSYWAVKQVKNDNKVDIEAFKKEVELLSSLNYPDIPRIVDRIELDNDFFVVMDFIDGTSLGKKVLAEGPSPEKDVVEWAKMLCDALIYLHNVKDNPIVYCDMKPNNVILNQSGRIKLIDFGIAKECRRGEKQLGSSVGTKGFAAPEQYKGSSNILDERTDIYGFGATLYYLVTGNVPGKPPKAATPIRNINPTLSEGLEYIISKCMSDAPEDRYQNCMELKGDLDNIQQLTGAYRNKMTRKLVSFISSLVACIVFIIVMFLGLQGIRAVNEDYYQAAFRAASESERKGDYENAAKYYKEAVTYKSDDYDTHLLFFLALLPRTEEADFINQTKSAIDEMRKSYIENPESGMYHNMKLMYQVAKRCIEVNDPAYAAFAVEYIQEIKESREYVQGDINTAYIDSYEIIATNCAKNLNTLDFERFNSSLINLEDISDRQELFANEKLENYYTIMLMYARYPNYLINAYERIYEIGIKARDILDKNYQSDDLTFNNIIPMYELVASSLYNSAVTEADVVKKEETYRLSIEWFEYLEDLNADLEETLEMRKGNAYKGIFDIYNTVDRRDSMDDSAVQYLDKAADVFRNIISKNSKSFLAHVYLTQTCLEREMNKTSAERDYSEIKELYDAVVSLKSNDKNLSGIALSQFSSLKRQMEIAGLEE